MSEWTVFGERLKKQLEERGMTYMEFAEKVGLSVPTICRFVNCETVPRATEVLKIANVLGVNCNYLLGVIDEPYRDCLYVPKQQAVKLDWKDDYISRQDAIDALDEIRHVLDKKEKELTILPSAEPERKKGKWIWCGDKHVCSECDEFALCDAYDVLETGEYQEELSDYCPNCGADMRGEEDG